ncbi:hypothetical protein GCM10025331_67960 [Actinoplanes utahensis]|nr:hypothetical protein Aut01nite_01160 [Actinoplanes utahensis]
MLYRMPMLDAADRRAAGEVDTMYAELRRHLRSKPRGEGQPRRSLFAAAIQGSNTIENITISSADARALAATVRRPGADRRPEPRCGS